jgi:hypothetical protein
VTLTTFGEVVLNLDMGLSKLIHTFHIVTEKFKIPFDGLLGIDFIRPKCEIDGPRLSLNFPALKIILPLFPAKNTKITKSLDENITEKPEMGPSQPQIIPPLTTTHIYLLTNNS